MRIVEASLSVWGDYSLLPFSSFIFLLFAILDQAILLGGNGPSHVKLVYLY